MLQEVVVDLVPGVFDECNGYIAEGWRELGANPSSSDLLVGVVASPENASVWDACGGVCRCGSGERGCRWLGHPL